MGSREDSMCVCEREYMGKGEICCGRGRQNERSLKTKIQNTQFILNVAGIIETIHLTMIREFK